MADILINGLALPKKGHCTIVAVFSDGSVDYRDREEMAFHRTTAVALPEHGRLISDTDVKALLHSGLSLDTDSDIDHVCGLIDGLPTIVEANNE